ncbi:hypothetical protein SMETP3_23790 [Serratia marcescens]|uniref:hypothetical protein n=1 Tax=Serratia TaxID=613 RepID=UPI0007C91959|nr:MULTISPECIES: hypothetical protein [Serratia]EMB4110279.1 type IV secretion protein Rhs [Serratia marcescens]MDH2270491.1 type IV secretion protein Rhs [Serratia marcescens]MDH2278467.1 type IV secretion protein Rhs [Serratia marcescens]OAH27686.1 type IV secretion protein Rhs [Serratia marcescens]PTA80636.1 type IV secretion protein Rhs [Serratia sp. Nf2]
MQKEEGSLRQLTLKEIALARTVFGGEIAYPRVWIHCASYLPFGLQRRGTAMTPNGELFFRKELYSPDFGAESTVDIRHLFIHEMMHVWQHQKGMWVRARGMFSWAADYTYRLDDRALLDYGLEQQAQIIADYYVLQAYGYREWNIQRRKAWPVVTYQGVSDQNTLATRYRKTLFRFLQGVK